MKMFTRIAALFMAASFAFILASCQHEIKEQVKTYTVTFYSNGGSNVESQKIKEGNKATEPPAPTKMHYDFEGWYNGFSKFYFYSTINSNITLNAKWTPHKYTITYEGIDGATNPNVTTYTVENNDITLQDASKPGSIFEGWYNGTEPVTNITTVNGGNITLTAQWSQTIPSTPQNIKARASGFRTIDVSWDAVEGASSYIVYYGQSPNASEEDLLKTETERTSFRADFLPIDQRYYFWVFAKNSIGNSDKSNVVSAVSCLPAPGGVNAYAQGKGYARVSWNLVSGAESYQIYAAKLDSYYREQEKQLCATSRGVSQVVKLTSGASYKFYVRAVYGSKTSAFSSATMSVIIH